MHPTPIPPPEPMQMPMPAPMPMTVPTPVILPPMPAGQYAFSPYFDAKYRLCCCHIRTWATEFAASCAVINLAGLIRSIVFAANGKGEALIGVWVACHVLAIVASVLALVGIKIERAWMLIAHMVMSVIFILGCIGCIGVMALAVGHFAILPVGLLFVPILIAGVLAAILAFNLYVMIRCYGYLADKRRAEQAAEKQGGGGGGVASVPMFVMYSAAKV